MKSAEFHEHAIGDCSINETRLGHVPLDFFLLLKYLLQTYKQKFLTEKY